MNYLPWIVEIYHVLCDHLPLYCPLEGVREQADYILLNLKFFCSFNVNHTRDVGKLKLGKKSVENLEIFVDFLCVVRGG